MNIILLGPQGSGKGTQGELISKKFNLYYFEAGDFLRHLAKTNKEIDHIVNEVGSLLPDDMMYKLVRDNFLKRNQFGNILFDGYPRSLPQYNLLTSFLAEHKAKIDMAFALEISENETIQRLVNRRMDPATGEIYNLITNPPPASIDVSKLVHREDDKEDVIRKRLSVYRSRTEPLIEKLRNEGKLTEIDGTQSIEHIFSQISSVIDSKIQ